MCRDFRKLAPYEIATLEQWLQLERFDEKCLSQCPTSPFHSRLSPPQLCREGLDWQREPLRSFGALGAADMGSCGPRLATCYLGYADTVQCECVCVCVWVCFTARLPQLDHDRVPIGPWASFSKKISRTRLTRVGETYTAPGQWRKGDNWDGQDKDHDAVGVGAYLLTAFTVRGERLCRHQLGSSEAELEEVEDECGVCPAFWYSEIRGEGTELGSVEEIG